MNAAIRLLTFERRWLSRAWETAEEELQVANASDQLRARLVTLQMDKLAEEIHEITEALEHLETRELFQQERLRRRRDKRRAQRQAAAV